MRYKFSNLIDIEKQQKLLDSFCDAVGIAAGIIDLKGEVLVGSRWQRICTDFHRVNKQTCKKCIESDTQLANELQQGKQFSIYQCGNGLTDAASPIIVEDKHLANVFVGQVFLKAPDREFFLRQAAAYGFEENAYLDALWEVPIVTKKNFTAILNFLVIFAEMVAMMGLNQLRQTKAKKVLRESEKKYRTLLETTSEGCWLLNPERKTIEVNASLCKMLGYSQDEMVGKRPFDFVDNENRKIFIEQTSKISDTEHRSYEIVLKKKNGEDLHTYFNATTIRDESGEVLGSFAFITDITERKQVEAALMESEQKYKLLVKNLPSIIYKGYKDWSVEFFDNKIESLTGYDVNEFNSKKMKWTDIIVEKDIETAREIFINALKTDKSFVREYRIKTKAGDILWIDDRGQIICDGNGEVEYVSGTFFDITKINKLEAQLQQSQKMESIGNLAGGIAHDFNNILSSVLGYTELSLDEVQKGTHIEDNLKEIYTAGKRAKDLVRQILAFARQSEEELKPIRVDTIATEVLKFIRSSIPTTIEIKQNIESDSLIMGNATQVHQILMNLFTNAAHAMEDKGGILEFSLKDIVMDRGVNRENLDLKPGNYIEIKVSDTGAGIAPEIIGSIFDPYFTTKGQGEGTGMGLATVYGIIESYGGKISVHSKPGQGTLFTIHLPVTRKRQEHRPYQSETLPTGKERILFVDDEAPIAKMGGQALERLGYTVSIRTSSIEALELFRFKANDFDLVITDMIMPNMTGDKLAVELLKIRPDIPVILCSGYSKKMSDAIALEIGIKAFAYKPVVRADLAKTVRKVLDDQQQEQITGRILVIDDESEIRKLFIKKLAARGYEIIEACDGKQGLKLYRENRPDLVITDLVMPEKEGIETITELKREFPKVKIIAISGGGRNIPDAYLQIAKSLGAERTFSKPIDWPELIKAVRKLLK